MGIRPKFMQWTIGTVTRDAQKDIEHLEAQGDLSQPGLWRKGHHNVAVLGSSLKGRRSEVAALNVEPETGLRRACRPVMQGIGLMGHRGRMGRRIV